MQKNYRQEYRHRSREEINEVDESSKGKFYRLTSILIKICNSLTFGLGLTLFIVGVLYLTLYRYEYSFTVYSIDLLAGIFISVGAITGAMGICGIFFIRPLGRPVTSILFSAFIFIFFLLLFILGVIGLSMNNNGEFLNQNRLNMIATAKKFDESNQYGHLTKKMNWLHRRFLCCGVDSYSDWKAIVTFRGKNGPIKYYENYQNENRYPYIDDVPDSCCVNPNVNCGKQLNVFGRDRSSYINTRGCLALYTKQFFGDIQFLSALAITVSCIYLVLSIILLYIFTLVRNNISALIENYDRNERKIFLR